MPCSHGLFVRSRITPRNHESKGLGFLGGNRPDTAVQVNPLNSLYVSKCMTCHVCPVDFIKKVKKVSKIQWFTWDYLPIPLLDYYGQVRSSAHKKAPTMHPGAGGL